jgi:hypothetical protein
LKIASEKPYKVNPEIFSETSLKLHGKAINITQKYIPLPLKGGGYFRVVVYG